MSSCTAGKPFPEGAQQAGQDGEGEGRREADPQAAGLASADFSG
ncbi:MULTISPECIES: hypothetical protein [unclassified Streptomyces]|nr:MULTISPECIES: hypothetical protein [unclassified Streptomyces]